MRMCGGHSSLFETGMGKERRGKHDRGFLRGADLAETTSSLEEEENS